MSTTSDEATTDPSRLCEEARELAERGELRDAARIFERVMALGDVPERAQAALGLAVVLGDSGDPDGSKEADWAAIETGHPEYAPRAAYHLALAHERAGERAQAAEAWRMVVDFDNTAYLAPAYCALARLADEDGDDGTAQDYWRLAIATRDPGHAPIAAHDLAQRLLDRGEPARAQRLLAETLRSMDREADPYAYARLAVTIGMAYLDQAIGAFGAALDGAAGDPEVRALATELLARSLPLRGRGDEAWEVWEAGIADPDVADEVRARLRRDFGDAEPSYAPAGPLGPAGGPSGAQGGGADDGLDGLDGLDESDEFDEFDEHRVKGAAGDAGAGEGGAFGGRGRAGAVHDTGTDPWWQSYLESAARSGTVPALAGEVFGAFDLLYTMVALRYAEGRGALSDGDHEVLGQAVRVPGRFAWGRSLHESFAERLRRAGGSDTPVLPPGWPDLPMPTA